ncbi:putative oxidoreductase [Gordonia effusa NBRC 100432]|uniref:Putative oxidoreductase n=1 Tax=Gordonia effusa NBRC 100432 TaxID=1077974 RepID=H0R5N3_9ACTN|nr:SDR family NAD(P)-dependent oxidoreductase [Gordonia effusa]GAB20384.1 putative oxidoreductase [Gordonia effusa NBRC 100432]
MKTVIVTGGAAGIGKETAKAFARQGNRVIIADIDEPAAAATATEIALDGGQVLPYRLDVRSEDEWNIFGKHIAAEFGHADILVNNAGVMDLGGFVETDPAGWQRMIDICLMSIVYGSKVFGQQMIDGRVNGHIVNVSSAAAFLPSELDAAYGVAKSAVFMASQSLRIELRQHGIGVTTICPGIIRTNLLRNGRRNGLSDDELASWNAGAGAAQTQLGISGPDKVARRIVKAVDKNWAVVPVNPEAWLAYYASRVSPGAVRAATSLGGFGLMEGLLRAATPLINRLAERQESIK